MKKIKFVTLAIAILGFSVVSFAQSASADGTIRLLTPISITKNADLRFGSVLTANAAGTVVIGVSNETDRNLGTYTDIAIGDAYGAAKFTVTGTASQAFKITLPTTVSLTGPGTALTVNTFTSDLVANEGTLNTSGTKIVLVGAKITIPANQTGGTYSGTFNVTVAYN